MMQLLGMDVKEKINSISKSFPMVQNKLSKREASGASADALKRKLASQSQTINQMKKELDTKISKIKGLKDDLKQIESQVKMQKKNNQSKEDARRASMYAQTYKNMDPEKAGAIFSQMDSKVAAKYLDMLDNKTKAHILENIPADKAAAITPLLNPKPETNQSANQG
ncbi:MgtE-like protein [Scopulibacillus darangshiensis]|uniref:MgtE-like protein n=1 Tax=Scopulibacillus darangshiensis TaxID=442528 RepID=A0A4R2P6G7_9BACL|nr:hypothetical protein [Scopulibacillus darangshiensis]TCP30327.1 MgtE-like protein [Scopulibacillus darangshiensis]